MPQVGGKHFSYNAKGRAAARKAAKRSGKPVTNRRPKGKR